jgi:hypothetical protein
MASRAAGIIGSTDMAVRAARTVDWQYQVHLVDANGDILETVALTLGFATGVAAFEAAGRTYSNATIEFRQRARVLRTMRTGLYDHSTKTIAVLSFS